MDYIQPESCTDAEFRKMWAEFEWENKIAVATNIGDLEAYLEHILQSTNMNCLTPKQVYTHTHTHTYPRPHTHTPTQALSGECGFLAANLYARSIFGEDALANVSVEKPPGSNQSVTGHIRIRAKTQVTTPPPC